MFHFPQLPCLRSIALRIKSIWKTTSVRPWEINIYSKEKPEKVLLCRYIRKEQFNFFPRSQAADLCAKKSIPFYFSRGGNIVGSVGKAAITYGSVKHLRYFFPFFKALSMLLCLMKFKMGKMYILKKFAPKLLMWFFNADDSILLLT